MVELQEHRQEQEQELIQGQVQEQRSYRNFVDTCRSPKTRDLYVKGIRYFMSFLGMTIAQINKEGF
jgi:hypothetical protein